MYHTKVRLVKSTLVAMTALCAGGCSLIDAQSQLTAQARKGITLVTQAQDAQAQSVEQFYALRRKQLDDAFDADVKEAPSLDANWVIAHRQAYMVGIDAVEKQHGASTQTADALRQNLLAIDQALERLQWLQSLQSQWISLDNWKSGK